MIMVHFMALWPRPLTLNATVSLQAMPNMYTKFELSTVFPFYSYKTRENDKQIRCIGTIDNDVFYEEGVHANSQAS